MLRVQFKLTPKQIRILNKIEARIMTHPPMSKEYAIIGQVFLRNDGSAYFSGELFTGDQINKLAKVLDEIRNEEIQTPAPR